MYLFIIIRKFYIFQHNVRKLKKDLSKITLLENHIIIYFRKNLNFSGQFWWIRFQDNFKCQAHEFSYLYWNAGFWRRQSNEKYNFEAEKCNLWKKKEFLIWTKLFPLILKLSNTCDQSNRLKYFKILFVTNNWMPWCYI